ncbi:MAG: hypothetical protein U1C50_00180 [Patescibacteria group bacterium]|nr:hypothetical protein [Candidatus Beckwithbacteria bacterium]MDZ4228651.1 hypothetical protein [Patescibacteria group bacterium]
MPAKLGHFRPLRPFTHKELLNIKAEFIRQSLAAGRGKPESLAWYDSLIEPWNKNLLTQTPAVIIDLGGSYLRKGVILWEGKKFRWLVPLQKELALNEHQNPLNFINWLVKKTLPLVKQSRASRIGLVFSYPHQPQKFNGHVTGVVTQLPKGLVVPGLKGVDIGRLYLKGLKNEGVLLEKFVILNDTVALALSKYQAQLGLVIGTGANICSMQPKLKNLRNIEAGDFNGVAHTLASASVDLSDKPGVKTMEKQSTGRYQFRNLAFAALLEGMRSVIGQELMQKGLEVESLIATEISQKKFELISELKLSQTEKQRLTHLSRIILKNSYQMWAAALAAVIELNKNQLKKTSINIPVTGGVILNDPAYFAGLKTTIESLTEKKIQLIKVPDPIKGAAVAALME